MKTLQDDGDFLQLLISFSMLSVTTVISLNSGNLPSFYQWLDMRRGRFLSYWTLSINNFSWLEFTWLQSLMIGLCSLTDGFGIWICIRYWNRRSIVQTRCPIDMCKCWIRLRDLRHLFLHLQQKLKAWNNVGATMMVTDLILTPHLPREELLLAFFLKKRVGTEDCNLSNWGCLSSTGTLLLLFTSKSCSSRFLGKSCLMSAFFSLFFFKWTLPWILTLFLQPLCHINIRLL